MLLLKNFLKGTALILSTLKLIALSLIYCPQISSIKLIHCVTDVDIDLSTEHIMKQKVKGKSKKNPTVFFFPSLLTLSQLQE